MNEPHSGSCFQIRRGANYVDQVWNNKELESLTETQERSRGPVIMHPRGDFGGPAAASDRVLLPLVP